MINLIKGFWSLFQNIQQEHAVNNYHTLQTFFQKIDKHQSNSVDKTKDSNLLSKKAVLNAFLSNKRQTNKDSILQYQNRCRSFLFQLEIRITNNRLQITKEELTCPICMQLINDNLVTSCGHTFCEKCIKQSLLRKAECPLCRNHIRNSQFFKNKFLQKMIQKQYLLSSQVSQTQQQSMKLLKERKKNQEQQKKNIKVSQFKVNDVMDVRDTEYIWCQGIVMNVQHLNKDKKLILIHYKGWSKIYDEYIDSQSQRFAKLGAYTSRDDIPRYSNRENREDMQFSSVIHFEQVILGRRQPQRNFEFEQHRRPLLNLLQGGFDLQTRLMRIVASSQIHEVRQDIFDSDQY